MSNCEFFDSTVESELRESGVYASVTKGSSMRPLFKTNRDVVILKRSDTEPRKYDVVLYKSGEGKYILHRIVKVLSDEFIIRGDNTYIPERVAKDRILATLTEFNRKGKKHKIDEIGYRMYSRFWNFIYPIRFLIFKSFMLAHRIYRKIFKKNK